MPASVPARRASGSPRSNERLIVSARWWNDLVRRWFRDRVRSVRSVAGDLWRPPWYSRLSWDAERAGWEVETKPGFCVRSPHREGSPRVVIPVDGVDVPLGDPRPGQATDGVPVRLPIAAGSWRAIGTDAETLGDEAEAVPPFFLERGVRAPNRVVVDRLTSTVSSRLAGLAADQDPATARLLRACDLVLQADRPAVRIDWEQADGAASGVGFARGALTIASAPNARGPAWLRIRKAPRESEASVLALAAGGFAQAPWDVITIATLYLLSPPGTTSGTDPDETWEPHVAQRVYWNLAYEVDIDTGAALPDPITLPVPLAAGVGQPLVNAITAGLNDQAALVTAAVDGARIEGRFYNA